MPQSVIQTAFHAGELSPSLFARVDLAKYHSGCALARNFFVDYRGGLSTRMGTRFINQVYKSSTPVRLIAFQASFTVSYILEFGDFYVRFVNNGASVLETGFAITGANQANPCVITVTGNNFSIGDWIFITGVVGMTQLNGKYFRVNNVSGANVTLGNIIDSSNVDSTSFGAYTSGGTASRVYTIPSPYAAADLALLKFAQNVNTMVLCHPNYVPYILTLISATNWTLVPISFGANIQPPTNPSVSTTLAASTISYAYVVTAVDASGQESVPSAVAQLNNVQDIAVTSGTNTVTWTAANGAVAYNVYKAQKRYGSTPVPTGAAYGFIGSCTGVTFIDTNIVPDFTVGFPVAENPFQGAGVDHITVTAPGTYTTVPGVTLGAAPAGGQTATASAILQVQGTPTISAGGGSWAVGEIGVATDPAFGTIALVVASVSFGIVTSVQPITFPGSVPGSVSSGNTPTNPVSFNKSGHVAFSANLTWGVGVVPIIQPGSGYLSAPSVTFSAGAAAATAVLAQASAGNPSVPQYFDQRLVLAGPSGSPQQFNMSQPGSYYNYNISSPIQPDDAIEETLVSGQLNTIKSMVSVPTGLIMLTSRAAWLINGSGGGAVTPIDITAKAHAYNGAGDLPPIVVNYDILFVQSKGTIVRDLSFNFYTQIYTGTDITVLSLHLFYGFTLLEWAYAEEPFKVVWVVRSDGALLSLTMVKEQELIGWCHSDSAGLFKSVATVTEAVPSGNVDAPYFVVQRVINGNTVQYIERMAERIFPNGVADAWCVDAALQYVGSPATVFSGLDHLEQQSVTGLADGIVIPPTTVVGGKITLSVAASKVTIGLPFTPQMQTLPLDVGEPTVQGKRKKIAAITARVENALGLSMGRKSTTLVNMKDLIVGNVGSATNQVVNGLVTGDARTVVDPLWDVPGQFFIQQSNPLPATILGVIPEIVVGDTPG